MLAAGRRLAELHMAATISHVHRSVAGSRIFGAGPLEDLLQAGDTLQELPTAFGQKWRLPKPGTFWLVNGCHGGWA